MLLGWAVTIISIVVHKSNKVITSPNISPGLQRIVITELLSSASVLPNSVHRMALVNTMFSETSYGI